MGQRNYKKPTGKKSRAGAVLACVMVLLALAVVLNVTVFRVRTIRITGSSSLPEDQVVSSTGIRPGESLFSIREEDVARSVENGGLLLFDGMRVDFPGVVTVAVRERQRAIMVLSGGTLLVLDPSCWVLSAESMVPDEGLLYVTGLDVTGYRIGSVVSAGGSRVSAVTEIYRALEGADALDMVSELNVQDLNMIYIWSRTGIHVSIGDMEHIGNKTRWMAAALRDLESRGETSGRLDVTSGNKADFDPD